MLRNSFIQLPNIGHKTEWSIWKSGIKTWDQFRSCKELTKLRGMHDALCSMLDECEEKLELSDGGYFNDRLPGSEKWRLYQQFREKAAFLDIETTGLSSGLSHITIVGLLDKSGYRVFTYEKNLDELPSALNDYKLIVTYNGSCFDLPFIEATFGSVIQHAAHIDLRFPLKRLGYRGGLKAIQSSLGLERPDDLTGLDGFDAVLLWTMWERELNTGAYDTLVRYNAEDVACLPALAEITYNRLRSTLPVEPLTLNEWPRPDISDLAYDRTVLDRIRLFHATQRITAY